MSKKNLNEEIYEQFVNNVMEVEDVKNNKFKIKVKNITKQVKKILSNCSDKDYVNNNILNSVCNEGFVIKNLINYVKSLEKDEMNNIMVDTMTHNLDISKIKIDLLEKIAK